MDFVDVQAEPIRICRTPVVDVDPGDIFDPVRKIRMAVGRLDGFAFRFFRFSRINHIKIPSSGDPAHLYSRFRRFMPNGKPTVDKDGFCHRLVLGFTLFSIFSKKLIYLF